MSARLAPLPARLAVSAAIFFIGFAVPVIAGLFLGVDATAGRALVPVPRAPVLDVLLINNVQSILPLVLGVATFGTTAVASLLLTGATVGSVVTASLQGGVSAALAASALLPHAVFEFPAICLAGATGMKGIVLAAQIAEGARLDLAGHLTGAIGSFAGASVMLVIAAYVECNITPLVIARTIGR